jgi:uncharacterized membrane protein
MRVVARGSRVAWPITCAAVLGVTSVASAADLHSVLDPAGSQAGHIHALWLLMLAVCSVVLVAVTIAVLLAVRRASRTDAHTGGSSERAERTAHRAVVIAIGISVVLLIGLFGATVVVDRALAQLPLTDAVHIRLTARLTAAASIAMPGSPDERQRSDSDNGDRRGRDDAVAVVPPFRSEPHLIEDVRHAQLGEIGHDVLDDVNPIRCEECQPAL